MPMQIFFQKKRTRALVKIVDRPTTWNVGTTLCGNGMRATSVRLCPFQNPISITSLSQGFLSFVTIFLNYHLLLKHYPISFPKWAGRFGKNHLHSQIIRVNSWRGVPFGFIFWFAPKVYPKASPVPLSIIHVN